MALLSVSDFDAGYEDLRVVEGVNLTVDDGEYVAVIGPNGAGKTTLLQSIFGLATRKGGTVEFDGRDLTDASTVEIVGAGMGLTPQEANVFPDLTVLENLRMGAYGRDELTDEQLDRVYGRFPILEERSDQLAGDLSGGQRQMLAIGRALVTEPDLLALDEPSAGLAPDLVDDLLDEIDAINDAGTAMLVVEQNARAVLRRADRGYVITRGRVRAEGDAADLRDDEEIREQFFGG